jgi:hypothetical protein
MRDASAAIDTPAAISSAVQILAGMIGRAILLRKG